MKYIPDNTSPIGHHIEMEYFFLLEVWIGQEKIMVETQLQVLINSEHSC